MTRSVEVSVLALLVLPALAVAQVAPDLGEIRQKASLTESDRGRIRTYIQQTVRAMLTNTDPDRRGMVAARTNLLAEVQDAEGRTGPYRQAFAQEMLAVLKETGDQAVSQPARVNVVMIVAGLQVLDAAPMLQQALVGDPYPASRYWAAKGLATLAPKIVQRVVPSLEREIAVSIEKALQKPQPVMVLMPLFEALGTFDHEQAHDVLADGLIAKAGDLDMSDPLVQKMVSDVIGSLERAYSREVRPEAKKRLLLAYATLCTHIMPPPRVPDAPPPAGYGRVMAELNASLEKVTGEDVGFESTEPLPLQQLALLEWVERLARTKRIDARPKMPAEVEEAVKARQAGGGGEAGGASGAGEAAGNAGA
ncbi:MAG: hypothetical protein R6X20_12160 [Phycisphaerae bacterium]